jgi:hypothetical protein
MAQAKLITVTIDQTGGKGFTVDTTGFQGKGCADIHKMFEGIGGPGTTTKKPEYNQTQNAPLRGGR